MTAAPNFPRFDGLMDLAKREGVDIRPTLLRVLTDLYVQTPLHSDSEERQYVELAARLISEVDDATRAAVRGRLMIYARAPASVLSQLDAYRPPEPAPVAAPPPVPAAPVTVQVAAPPLAPEPAEEEIFEPSPRSELRALHDMFLAATSPQRLHILRKFESVPLSAPPRIDSIRARHTIASLERAALDNDRARFAFELAEVLVLPRVLVNRIVDDPGGEPLLFAARLLELPSAVLQRILMFLPAAEVATTAHIFRLARLYETVTPRVAAVMLAAWRASATPAPRARHAAQLYDDESGSVRAAQTKPGQARPQSFARRARDAG